MSAGTPTSRFGTGKRERHDATERYARGLSEVAFSTDRTVNEVPARVRNRVFVHTAEEMGEWPDDSVALR